MIMRNSEEKRLQRVVAYTSATLFALFTFFYVVVYQSPLMEAFYDYIATGKLEYNEYVVAGILTAALTLLALWLNRFARFQREWTAMAYLPSALILAFITDIDRSVYTGGGSWLGWSVIFIVGLLVYVSLAFVLQRVLFEKIKSLAMSANRVIWRNIIILTLQFALVGTLSNGEENFKREALVVSYNKDGEVEKALSVGYKSLDASQQLTAIRAYVMAANGLLGERVFEYPQLYGSAGLLLDVTQTSPFVPDTLYSLFGEKPSDGESVSDFLSRVAHKDSVPSVVKEYYLTSLLLDKHIMLFKNELDRMLGVYDPDSLPKHFREALVLYSDIDTLYNIPLSSDTLFQELDSLRRVELKYDDPVVRGNYVRKEFGRTYWWYFLYGN